MFIQTKAEISQEVIRAEMHLEEIKVEIFLKKNQLNQEIKNKVGR